MFWIKAGRYLDHHPTGDDVLLPIEVADSSLQSDRTTKTDLYPEAHIQEYWLVDVQGQCIHQMRDVSADRQYGWQRTIDLGDEISPLAEPNAVLKINELFGVES